MNFRIGLLLVYLIRQPLAAGSLKKLETDTDRAEILRCNLVKVAARLRPVGLRRGTFLPAERGMG